MWHCVAFLQVQMVVLTGANFGLGRATIKEYTFQRQGDLYPATSYINWGIDISLKPMEDQIKWITIMEQRLNKLALQAHRPNSTRNESKNLKS